MPPMKPQLDATDRYLIQLVKKSEKCRIGHTFEHNGRRIKVAARQDKIVRLMDPKTGTWTDIPRNIEEIANKTAILEGRFG